MKFNYKKIKKVQNNKTNIIFIPSIKQIIIKIRFQNYNNYKR